VAVHRALFLLERVYLHAAGVVFGETCWVFVGDKGSGKSTLSLALGAAGATVLADDHVVLARDGERFLASGCDGEARVLDDVERHLFGTPVDAESSSSVACARRRSRSRASSAAIPTATIGSTGWCSRAWARRFA
jgi:hypothetical protein